MNYPHVDNLPANKFFYARFQNSFPNKVLLEDGIIMKSWFGSSPSQVELFAELGL